MHEKLTNIFLTGFAGAGKTTLGNLLAGALKWKFVDTDAMVEKTAGMSVARLFETEGAAAFRSADAQAVAQATTGKKTVVALGGTALLDRNNRERVFRSGFVVYLEASVDTLVVRTSGTQRSLLRPDKGKTLRDTISDQLASRKFIHEQAHLKINVDNRTPEEIVQEIVKGAEGWNG